MRSVHTTTKQASPPLTRCCSAACSCPSTPSRCSHSAPREARLVEGAKMSLVAHLSHSRALMELWHTGHCALAIGALSPGLTRPGPARVAKPAQIA